MSPEWKWHWSKQEAGWCRVPDTVEVSWRMKLEMAQIIQPVPIQAPKIGEEERIRENGSFLIGMWWQSSNINVKQR